MEHANAIAGYLLPLLGVLICGLASWGLYMHKQFMARNEKEHEGLIKSDNEQGQRLTRVETKIEHVEDELRILKR